MCFGEVNRNTVWGSGVGRHARTVQGLMQTGRQNDIFTL